MYQVIVIQTSRHPSPRLIYESENENETTSATDGAAVSIRYESDMFLCFDACVRARLRTWMEAVWGGGVGEGGVGR